MTQATKNRLEKNDLLDLVMSGEPAHEAGCDTRTFLAWVRKLGIKPIGVVSGNKLVFERTEAAKVVRAYKEHVKEKVAKKKLE